MIRDVARFGDARNAPPSWKERVQEGARQAADSVQKMRFGTSSTESFDPSYNYASNRGANAYGGGTFQAPSSSTSQDWGDRRRGNVGGGWGNTNTPQPPPRQSAPSYEAHTTSTSSSAGRAGGAATEPEMSPPRASMIAFASATKASSWRPLRSGRPVGSTRSPKAPSKFFTALAGAVAYGDVITSLEYKGLMVLVLGLAVWSLEVARAALDPSSYPGAVLAAAEDVVAAADVLRHGAPAGDGRGRLREQAPVPEPGIEAALRAPQPDGCEQC